jgi:NADH:ubiquinone oxidoreductase subunit 4 (subunit M)
MVNKLRAILGYRMSVAEWIGSGLILGVPYLIVGLIWSTTHTDQLRTMHGADLVVSFLGSIVSWPVLLFANVCMT